MSANSKAAEQPILAPRGFRNRSNFVRSAGEVNDHPSETIPDQAIPLREMLNRHLNGGVVKQFSPVFVDSENPLPIIFERMSRIDQAQLLHDVSDMVETTRGRVETRRMERERLAFIANRDRLAAEKAALLSE